MAQEKLVKVSLTLLFVFSLWMETRLKEPLQVRCTSQPIFIWILFTPINFHTASTYICHHCTWLKCLVNMTALEDIFVTFDETGSTFVIFLVLPSSPISMTNWCICEVLGITGAFSMLCCSSNSDASGWYRHLIEEKNLFRGIAKLYW